MTARYVGMRDRNWNEGKGQRAVELGYDESEAKAFDRVIFLMKLNGWEIDTGVFGWGLCIVEDRSEADDFLRDWKACKRCIMNCMKYGF